MTADDATQPSHSQKRAPPRLGRGLAALFGEAQSTAVLEGDAQNSLPIDSLRPGPFQPRTGFDPASLAELTTSVRNQGVLQPILVRPNPSIPGQFEIIAGERRWRAAQAAGLHQVPVLVRALSDTDAMAASLVENLQRQDLDPIEEAEGYTRLVEEFGLTQEQLGDLVGKSRSHVANILRLLQLAPGLREHVKAGTLSAGHARALLSHPDQEQAAKTVIARGLNVRQTEALARQSTNPKIALRHDSRQAPDLPSVFAELSSHLGLQVRYTSRGEGGSLHIDVQNPEQLEGILRLLRSPEQ